MKIEISKIIVDAFNKLSKKKQEYRHIFKYETLDYVNELLKFMKNSTYWLESKWSFFKAPF